jgi:exonuclease VII large subunit
MHMSDGASEAITTLAQDVQAAQREAAQQGQAQQAQQAQQQAQREVQQAQREAQQAQREAQQAQQEAQREAQQAQREAQQAVRQMQAELARTSARAGQAVPFPPLPPFPPGGPQIPEGAVIISVAFFVMCAVIAIGVPIVRAFTRRMDRRTTAAPATDVETRDRLERIEQAVEAIAVEVERISEGQRFTTKIISELRGLPQPDPSAALAERSGDRSAVPLSRAREAR